MKFVMNKKFYPQPTWEFNLPAGHTCPMARECRTLVGRHSGKFSREGTGFRCYAAKAERFPGVRASRWENLDGIMSRHLIVIPPKATHIRIHASGDFFAAWYLDLWLDTARANPAVTFWAYTKSISFWLAARADGRVPNNLTLTASYGGLEDHLISLHGLKSARVYRDITDVPDNMLIDYDDSLAMTGTESFALLDNDRYPKSAEIAREHNLRVMEAKNGKSDL